MRLRAAWLDEEGDAAVEQCALLLNAMWPKSWEWRLSTLRKQPVLCGNEASAIVSSDQGAVPRKTSCLLPRSLVFYLEDDAARAGSMPGAMVAHGRLKEGEDSGTLIGSVVVADQLRGKGLGRTLMEELEKRAISMGLREAWLTTDDQEGFYSALGYTKKEADIVPLWAVKGGGRGPAPPAALIKAKMSEGVWMRKGLGSKGA